MSQPEPVSYNMNEYSYPPEQWDEYNFHEFDDAVASNDGHGYTAQDDQPVALLPEQVSSSNVFIDPSLRLDSLNANLDDEQMAGCAENIVCDCHTRLLEHGNQIRCQICTSVGYPMSRTTSRKRQRIEDEDEDYGGSIVQSSSQHRQGHFLSQGATFTFGDSSGEEDDSIDEYEDDGDLSDWEDGVGERGNSSANDESPTLVNPHPNITSCRSMPTLMRDAGPTGRQLVLPPRTTRRKTSSATMEPLRHPSDGDCRSKERSAPPRTESTSSIKSIVSCRSCSATFSRADVRKRHEDAVHSTITTKVTCGDPASRWGCGKQYKNDRSLKDHWSRKLKDGTGVSCLLARDTLLEDITSPATRPPFGRKEGPVVCSSETEPRSDRLYEREPHADGYYHCPYEGFSCFHKPTRLKPNFEEYIDSHANPYICRRGCLGLSWRRFSDPSSLLSHYHEVHPSEPAEPVERIVLFQWLDFLREATKSRGTPVLHDPVDSTDASATEIVRQALECIKKLQLRNDDLERSTHQLEVQLRKLRVVSHRP